MNNGTIELVGMKFHAFHGCLESERINGNTFFVDFKANVNMSAAASSDLLKDTLDYGPIYDLIAAEMAIPSKLIEHVAGRIVAAIAAAHPGLDFEISICKHNPPVAGPCACSKVTLRSAK